MQMENNTNWFPTNWNKQRGASAGNYSYLLSILLTKNDRDLVTLLHLDITILTCKQALLSIANDQVYPDEMKVFL